jgi:enterochelin esterase-like enzyme
MDWFEPDEGNIAYLLDSLIQNKHIPPIRAVSLNAGNSWYVDRQERMNSFYLSEFIPFIEHTYAENTKQISRIIAGNSAGGYGALRFAFQKPHLFKTVLLLSPAAYDPLPPAISSSRKIDVFAMDGSFNDSVWTHFSYTNLKSSFLNAPSHPKFYISVGDDDAYTIVPVVTSIQQFFVQNQVENELRITDGGHDWNCWRDNFTSALVDSFSE